MLTYKDPPMALLGQLLQLIVSKLGRMLELYNLLYMDGSIMPHLKKTRERKVRLQRLSHRDLFPTNLLPEPLGDLGGLGRALPLLAEGVALEHDPKPLLGEDEREPLPVDRVQGRTELLPQLPEVETRRLQSAPNPLRLLQSHLTRLGRALLVVQGLVRAEELHLGGDPGLCHGPHLLGSAGCVSLSIHPTDAFTEEYFRRLRCALVVKDIIIEWSV